MFTTKLRENDGTYSFDVPREVVLELHLQDGSDLDVMPEGEQFVVKPRRSRYSLGQLLKEHAEIIEELGDNREWVDAPPVGRELI